MTDKKDLRIPDYLQHILEAIGRIETYLAGVDQLAFFESSLLQDAVMRNLEIIGEAANNIMGLDKSFEKRFPSLEFRAAYGMRNALSHGYFNVDIDLVWGTVRDYLPALKNEVTLVLESYSSQLKEER